MTLSKGFKRRRNQLALQIATHCRSRRHQLGYSQRIAALITGLSLDTVKQIENPTGKKLPSVDSLARYAEGLGLSLSEVFADDAKAA